MKTAYKGHKLEVTRSCPCHLWVTVNPDRELGVTRRHTTDASVREMIATLKREIDSKQP